MPKCHLCSFNAKNKGGLTSHVRACQKKMAMNPVNDTPEDVPAMEAACGDCSTLPAGSVEVVSLLLVLVFSLSAVLVTSVYALNSQAGEIEQLQAEVAALQAE